MKALLLAPFSTDALETLGRLLPFSYESWTETRRLYPPDELSERINREGIGILVVEADFILREVFEEARPLRFLGVCRRSLDHIDVEAATEYGVLVVHTPGRNAQAVAELTIGLLLSLARGIPQAHSYVKSLQWEDPVGPYISMRGIEVGGRVLGILGLGAIGRRVARLARGLGMRVLAHDPYLGPPGRRRAGALLVGLEQALREADFLSIHAPATPETEGMLDARRIGLMKRGAYIINTAAHSIVVEEALVEALESGHLAGAAFDVHEAHPIPPTSPLLKLDRVVLTPHIGGATYETFQRQSWMMLEEIRRFLEGRRPRHLANPAVWRRRGR